MMECAPCRWLNEKRGSRKLVIVVVYLALLLDNMLLTVVVPLIPRFLYDIEHNKGNASVVPMSSSSASNSSLSSIYSLYDNATIISDHSNHQRIANKTQEAPKNARCNMETSVLQEENVQVGLMFASKAIIQLLVNPIVGIITNRVGYDMPMLCGFVILFSSTILFAFAGTYTLMFLARSMQGVGSSLCAVSGMGMLANVYPDDYERGKAMGKALGGQALAGLTGPTFGSVMYTFIGKASPFLVLATLALLAGVLQLCILRPSKLAPESIPSIPYLTLLTDPYILVAAGAFCSSNTAVGFFEPTLPIWIMETMCSPNWQLGLSFLPAGIMYLLCTNLFGILAYKMGRWLCTLVGLIFLGVSLLCIPLAGNIYGLIGPNAGIGIALGMVDTSVAPIMGQLVDLRHKSVYGGVYAISDMALCLGFVVGPLLGGIIAKAFGFPWLMVIAGVLNIVYAPLCLLLRNPPAREEKMAILSQECPRESKTNMAQSNSPDQPLSDHSRDEDLSVPQNCTMMIPR